MPKTEAVPEEKPDEGCMQDAAPYAMSDWWCTILPAAVVMLKPAGGAPAQHKTLSVTAIQRDGCCG